MADEVYDGAIGIDLGNAPPVFISMRTAAALFAKSGAFRQSIIH